MSVAMALAIVAFPPWDGWQPWRSAATAATLGVVMNLPWLIPSLLGPRVPDNPSLAQALFRARSDSPLGTVGSLLSLGGIWRTDLAPPGRGGLMWIPAFVLIVGLVLAGWALLGRRWPAGCRAGLLAVAAGGLVLAAAPSIPGLDAASRALARLPGGGLIRDSQKFVMPLALMAAVSFGLGVERFLDALPTTDRLVRILAAGSAVLPVALAPTLAWGASGRLFTTDYPSSWARANAIVSADRAPGGLLTLPWHAYLPFDWNRVRTVHQPAPLYFSRPVLASTALEVDPFELPQEDPWARAAAPVVTPPGRLAPAALSRLGVRYVLLFKEADWRAQVPRLVGLASVLDTPDLRLYRGAPARIPTFPTAPPVAVVLADLLSGGVLLVAVVRLGSLVARRSRLDILRPSKGGR